ncbi:hypothetical protein [Sinomonas sp. P47F7]|uniref:hypothetical protein n=1 Tax=Sinomonas sp. P47F7 TaxID=3410987 RepID=UPI003BF4B541
MDADALSGGTTTQTKAPSGPRVAVVVSALISCALIAVNIRASIGPPNMISVEVPWLGLTEAGILLLALWPAWKGRLWALSAQTVVLLFVVFHSYWLLATTPWMSAGGGFLRGNSAVWSTGFGQGYLLVMLPYSLVIASEATFVVGQLKARWSKTAANASTGDAGAAPRGDGERQRPTGGKGSPVRAPVRVRVVAAITGLVAVQMTGLLWFGSVWQGVPEAVVLVVVLGPAWRGKLWAVSAQGSVLLIAVFHSFVSFYSQPNPMSGLGGYYPILLAPLLALILFDVDFVLRQLRSRQLPRNGLDAV